MVRYAWSEPYFVVLIMFGLDLHGRGYSEAPKVPSSPNLYTAQLASLLQYIGWEKANIVGFSIVRTAL